MNYRTKHDELREEHMNVFDVLSNWFEFTEFKIVHFWEDKGTFYIVAQLSDLQNNVLAMIRVFSVGNELKLSVDYVELTS